MSPGAPNGAAGAALAWLAHALTACGAVLAFLALIAVIGGDYSLALVWLLAALALDGVDGSFARRVRAAERAPRIDGATLDLVIDYLNYVFVPAVILWRAALVPTAWAPLLCGLVLVSALYNFTRRDLKTEDWYFRGFPALWNVVAFYLLVGRPGEGWGAATVVFFALLTFAPAHFVHPFRVSDYGRWLPALAICWAAATAALLWPGWSEAAQAMWLWTSLSLAAVLLAMGLLRTLRGPRSARKSA